MIFTKEFWMDTFERTLGTMAEATIGVIGAATTFSQIDWTVGLQIIGIAALATVCKCVIVATVGKKNGD